VSDNYGVQTTICQNALFGQCIECDSYGKYIIIGAPSADYVSINVNGFLTKTLTCGIAYVLKRTNTTWSVFATLYASTQNNPAGGITNAVGITPASDFTPTLDTQTGANFGESVSISADGRYAIIGSPDYTSGGKTSSGAVYIFRRFQNKWIAYPRFTAILANGSDSRVANAQFGNVVKISKSGTFFAVTEGGYDADVSHRMFIYQRSGTTWTINSLFTISGSGLAATDKFGALSMSADDNYIFLGSPKFNNDSSVTSNIFIYTKDVSNVWSLYKTIVNNSNRGSQYGMGLSLACSFSGNTFIAGNRFRTADDVSIYANLYKLNNQTDTNDNNWNLTENVYAFSNSSTAYSKGAGNNSAFGNLNSLSISADAQYIAIGNALNSSLHTSGGSVSFYKADDYFLTNHRVAQLTASASGADITYTCTMDDGKTIIVDEPTIDDVGFHIPSAVNVILFTSATGGPSDYTFIIAYNYSDGRIIHINIDPSISGTLTFSIGQGAGSTISNWTNPTTLSATISTRCITMVYSYQLDKWYVM
jgi:hypothetical protein